MGGGGGGGGGEGRAPPLDLPPIMNHHSFRTDMISFVLTPRIDQGYKLPQLSCPFPYYSPLASG